MSNTWVIWYARGDDALPWRIQSEDGTILHKASKIEFMHCWTITEFDPTKTGSHPPPATIVAVGELEIDGTEVCIS